MRKRPPDEEGLAEAQRLIERLAELIARRADDMADAIEGATQAGRTLTHAVSEKFREIARRKH